jgi:hypothetical protein
LSCTNHEHCHAVEWTEGRKITGGVFDLELYEKAKQLKYKAIRIDKFGYDPKE